MNRLRNYTPRGIELTAPGLLPTWPQPSARPGRQWPLRLPGLAGAPPNVTRQRVANLDVIFAIDESGSVHGPDGTDPQGARNAACLSVVDLMQRHGGGRAGVVHWGSTAPASLALAPMPVYHRRLQRGLRIQPKLGGTRPEVALARVRKLIRGNSSGRTLAVLLITDGQNLGTGLDQALKQLPARSVHLILVDPSGDCWGQEAAWRELPWGSFSRLESLSHHKRMAWESGTVIARSIGLRLSGHHPGQAETSARPDKPRAAS
jgi:hypothetical protein